MSRCAKHSGAAVVPVLLLLLLHVAYPIRAQTLLQSSSKVDATVAPGTPDEYTVELRAGESWSLAVSSPQACFDDVDVYLAAGRDPTSGDHDLSLTDGAVRGTGLPGCSTSTGDWRVRVETTSSCDYTIEFINPFALGDGKEGSPDGFHADRYVTVAMTCNTFGYFSVDTAVFIGEHRLNPAIIEMTKVMGGSDDDLPTHLYHNDGVAATTKQCPDPDSSAWRAYPVAPNGGVERVPVFMSGGGIHWFALYRNVSDPVTCADHAQFQIRVTALQHGFLPIGWYIAVSVVLVVGTAAGLFYFKVKTRRTVQLLEWKNVQQHGVMPNTPAVAQPDPAAPVDASLGDDDDPPAA